MEEPDQIPYRFMCLGFGIKIRRGPFDAAAAPPQVQSKVFSEGNKSEVDLITLVPIFRCMIQCQLNSSASRDRIPLHKGGIPVVD